MFVVEEVKVGRQTSILHIRLYQGAENLLSHAPWVCVDHNFAARSRQKDDQENYGNGEKKAAKVVVAAGPDFRALARREDGNWTWMRIPEWHHYNRIKHLENCECYVPRAGKKEEENNKNDLDIWLRFPGGREKFTDEMLGYVVDAWPTIVEEWRPGPPSPAASGEPEPRKKQKPFSWDRVFWYSTVVMNLEVKKRLNPDGEEWLFIRVTTRMVRNGRLDLEVLVFDSRGEMVAISEHACFVMGLERNVGGETREGEEAECFVRCWRTGGRRCQEGLTHLRLRDSIMCNVVESFFFFFFFFSVS